MTDNERTSENFSIIITTLGREKEEESDAQGVMVLQVHHITPSYILTLDKK